MEIQKQIENDEFEEILHRKSRISESQSITSDSNNFNRQNEDARDIEQVGDTLIESESVAVGSVAFGVYIRYIKSIGYCLITFVLIFTFGSEASAVLSNCK